MTKRPRLLDLFCGAGGCAVGYHRAGFDVVGVDHKPQKSYPFEFIECDALDYAHYHARRFDAIHASPPCQAYTVGRHIHRSGHRHPDLVERCRELLTLSGKPWVMENVMGAPLRDAAVLCGMMFGLRVLRHRQFEASFLLLSPPHPQHPKGNLTNSCHGYSDGSHRFVSVAGHNFNRVAAESAMGIDWMKTRHELAQAIPPAYTEFIGRQLIDVLAAN